MDAATSRLTSRAWAFDRPDGDLIAPQLRLLPGGRIGLHQHPNEASWALRDGALCFLDADGCVTTAFADRSTGDGLRLEGAFVRDPRFRHRLRETPKLERFAEGADEVVPLDRGTGGRANLVVLRADRSSLHTAWARDIATGDRNWDLCISWYGADCTTGTDPDADLEAMQTADRKFEALWKLFGASSPLWRYEHVMFPDDDLRMGWRDINRIFELARAHNLLLAQPSLSEDGFVTHGITRSRPGCRLRFTDFVEVMTPVFSREALAVCAPTFGMSRSGFGLDHVWPKLLGDPPGRIAILDDVAVAHTREMATSYSLQPAIDEGHRLMRAFGAWPSYGELGRIDRG